MFYGKLAKVHVRFGVQYAMQRPAVNCIQIIVICPPAFCYAWLCPELCIHSDLGTV